MSRQATFPQPLSLSRHCAGFVFSVVLMFKSMTIYRIGSNWQSDLQVLKDPLQRTVFEECGATQECSVGWVMTRCHSAAN